MTEQPTEYEQITINVPKQIMELLRFAEKGTGETPKSYIETAVLQTVRSHIEGDALIPNEGLVEAFSLKPLFESAGS
jgi:hypothetical protein